MAVWGRAIAVVGLLGALAACEYADEGEPRPSAAPSSSSPVQLDGTSGQPEALPAPTPPDPEKERRAQKALNQISTSLGKLSPATVTKAAGGISPSSVDPAFQEGGLTASSRVDAGRYRFRTTCQGDHQAFLIVIDESDAIAPRSIRCGEIDETYYTLAGGTVTIRLRGITPGVESAGGIHVVKVAAKP